MRQRSTLLSSLVMASLGTPVSACRFSTRISLRWLPESAQETTDTIVMSVGEWYLDLRMEKSTGKIDWAIAGQRLIESQEPLRVSFTHELDSHDAFESADCGTFVTLPNGDDLETGSMPRPDIPGEPMTEYEEVWRELPFRAGPEGAKEGISWVLESDDGELSEGEVALNKVFLGRIWGTYLALQQTQVHKRHKGTNGKWTVSKSGSDVSARREEWSSEWKDRYVVGANGATLPSISRGFEGEGIGSWRVPGEKVKIAGRQYIVRAFEEISYSMPSRL
ncbi:uncharacterized protein N7469_007815 [Penicillium citrinum]|uniref:Protein HRI1 n=2 Tax=Penicillium TaxID=5073 RepID=A0A9W9TIP9_PENCI|nr:uncharacterized protein N7469_007815 [Penicillium citrinum]KAJ5224312.1 hypothetical protein N7469_007815 [Penicillium citrinum]KAJ5574564.1 hypothetical protein N7450_008463 [Penicillium hetheringtonii]